jgi:hypothetical protein
MWGERVQVADGGLRNIVSVATANDLIKETVEQMLHDKNFAMLLCHQPQCCDAKRHPAMHHDPAINSLNQRKNYSRNCDYLFDYISIFPK